jgi:hypothetical protein
LTKTDGNLAVFHGADILFLEIHSAGPEHDIDRRHYIQMASSRSTTASSHPPQDANH